MTVFATPAGFLEVIHDECFIYSSRFTSNLPNNSYTAFDLQIKTVIEDIFTNTHPHTKLPFSQTISPFQQKVHGALLTIPRGETRTYGEIAKQLGSSPRAIGQACKRNPFVLFIPCHRVVGKNTIGGYQGVAGMSSIKRILLEHEGARFNIKNIF